MTTKTERKSANSHKSHSSGKKTAEATDKAVVRALLDRQRQTYTAQAGIRLRNTPAPLFQTLVLAILLSARIKADIGVAAARALFDAGLRDPRSMADASWQKRVDALGEGGYRRYDERTSTMLGKGAELVLERYDGDLRRLREEPDPRAALLDIPGIGPTGADIFLRDVQGVWPEFTPYIDGKALDGARRLGLPTSPEKLSDLVTGREMPRLADGLVHAALDKPLADEVRAAATSA
ncbi:endonuclease [Streptomyces sp. NPDC001020]